MMTATTTVSEARQRIWDAIVVGAGPAGTVAALGIVRRGFSVLLVDRSEFPRHKLCGACLNGDAIAGLRELGVSAAFEQLQNEVLNQFCLRTGGRSLTLELPAGVAVTRSRLDEMLVRSVIKAGVEFIPDLSLELEPTDSDEPLRHLSTTDRNNSDPLRARLVIMATGLPADRHTSDADLAVVPSADSRIGAGTTTNQFPAEYTPGTIFMAVGRDGYVGLTRTGGNSLNIAAALDRDAVRKSNPQSVCENILQEAGFPVTAEMLSGDWRGTIGLTRHRQMPASTRVLVVGDAAGYVEPFTGEGMAWAIRGAQAVVPFAVRAIEKWDDRIIEEWTRTSKQLIGRRQRWCRILARLLRHPFVVRSLVRLVTTMPWLGRVVIRQLNKEHRNEMHGSRTRHSSAT